MTQREKVKDFLFMFEMTRRRQTVRMWELFSGSTLRVFEQPSPVTSVALHMRIWEGPEDSFVPAQACQAFIEVCR